MNIELCTREHFIANEEEWLKIFEDESIWNSVPLLNANAEHNFKESSLVRFTGMLQDMHGPEYYYEKFEVLNEKTQEVYNKSSKYTDFTECQENENINLEGSSTKRSERQTYSIITVPGLNDWVKNIERDKLKLTVTFPTSTTPKRPLDSDSREASSAKRSYSSATPQTQNISTETFNNFPIPASRTKLCYVKMYKDFDQLKLNEIYDFIGFLSVNSRINPGFERETPLNIFVPTIHCISFKCLKHNNPLIRYCNFKMSNERMQYIRKELLICLTQLLCGDRLAAEYLLYHFISEIYLRNGLMVIGKFTFNISRVPKLENMDFVCEIYKFIELLLTKSHYFAMSLDNMNKLTLTPTRNYETNRLNSNLLQLSNHTHLILDETKLTPGKLNENGIKSIQALNHAIKNQDVMYDFRYYQLKFDCDIPFLIFSEGRSMLPSDFHVKLETDSDNIRNFPEILVAARHFLNPELLSEIRVYLTQARHNECEIPDDMEKLVQNHFVAIRALYDNVSADDLHNLLVLARLVSMSLGVTALNEECWKMTCDLEKQRRERK